jgi:hypothetical protein
MSIIFNFLNLLIKRPFIFIFPLSHLFFFHVKLFLLLSPVLSSLKVNFLSSNFFLMGQLSLFFNSFGKPLLLFPKSFAFFFCLSLQTFYPFLMFIKLSLTLEFLVFNELIFLMNLFQPFIPLFLVKLLFLADIFLELLLLLVHLLLLIVNLLKKLIFISQDSLNIETREGF